MNPFYTAITKHAQTRPDAVAIEGDHITLTYANLKKETDKLAHKLCNHHLNAVALLADNGPAWCIADLACLQAELTLTPIPLFFSPQQITHLINTSGIDAILTQQAEPLLQLLTALDVKHETAETISIAAQPLQLIRLHLTTPSQAPAACAKVTFTSGSTGEPKGVCLQADVMQRVSHSLAQLTGANASDRHISLLPYATLLENIGGIYVPLLSGATVVSPSLADVGLSGSSGLDIKTFVGTLIQSQATTCIMIPQMLHALVAAIEAGAPQPHTLRFIAVGGAPVSEQLLQRADALGLPVYEGYGLSEASSVVAVNSPCHHKPGSVGKILPHATVNFSDDGEILVKGGLFSGYLGELPFTDEYWPTGDIGSIDNEGFLYLSGRKKHIFITAFGRNVSPEWVERELCMEPVIAQCCLFGEARPFNIAIIVARNSGDKQASTQMIQASVDAANKQLPDYASISAWILADETFSIANGLWTGTGRPRRQFIFKQYEQQIEQLYTQQQYKQET